MKILNPEENKPDITYPCLWQYKIIGKDEQLIREAIDEICSPAKAEIHYSNQSSSGKYHSFNVELEVTNEKVRNDIFAAFQTHPHISMVI